MDALLQPSDRALYEADEHAWIAQQVELLRTGRLDQVGRESLAEFLTDMARRDRREIENRFMVLAAHLLKIAGQPSQHTRSWNTTVLGQQARLRRGLRSTPSLAALRDEILADVYADAVALAASGTGLPTSAFPAGPPWTADAALAFVPPEPPRRSEYRCSRR